MTHISRIMRCSFAALLAIGVAVPAFAAHPYAEWAEDLGIDLNVSYDGVRVTEMDGNTLQTVERRAPQKMYTEINVSNVTGAVLMREDLNKSYILMPGMGIYREMSLNEGAMQSSSGMEFSKIKKDGRDVVNGYKTTKYKVRFKDNNGKGAGIVWVSDDGIPMKMDMLYKGKRKDEKLRMVQELTELNVRPQDPSHFELPADMKPMNLGNIGAMLNQAQQNAGGNQAQQIPGGQPPANNENQQQHMPASLPGQGNVGERIGKAAKDEAEDNVIQETRKKIGQGIRGLFNR